MSLSIVRSLRGKNVLLTGATGFLGLALVEKLLRHVPDCRLTLLVRSADHVAASSRFHKLVADDELFAGLSPNALARIDCLAGDITAPGLGLAAADRAALRGHIALVIHAAASVDFDEPLDEAVRINIEGPLAVQALATEIGAGLLHISTAYVCGQRSGTIADALEAAGPFAGCLPLGDLDEELAAMRVLVERLHAEHGRTPDDGARINKKLTQALMTAGREHANARGWTDIYTFTKYLAERLLVRGHGEQALGIFRPAIIESAARGHLPGWLRGVKVMDMVLAAYGKGMIPGFPMDRNAPLDIIPVDMVASAVLAQAAQLISERDTDKVSVCQLGTSASNPLLLRMVSEYTYAHYLANPLPDSSGRPILVSKPRFPLLKNHALWLERYLGLLNGLRALLDRKALAGSSLRRTVATRQKNVKRYLTLARMFGAYTQTRRQFTTARADALYLRLSPDEQQMFNFAHHAIDWRQYMLHHHLPALDRLLTLSKGQ
jgi:alcohol-forming fatty acyl-CoA reductase